jgi:NADH-quinone oxidoreductase subunit G
LKIEGRAPALILLQMAENLPAFAGMTYQKLAETSEQWPLIGRHDLYFGGTMYDNHQGLGAALPLLPVSPLPAAPVQPALAVPSGGLLAAPVTRLYDQGTTLAPSSPLLKQRLGGNSVWINPATAARLGLTQGDDARLELGGAVHAVQVHLEATVPLDVVLLPRPMCMEPLGIESHAIHSVKR